MHPVRVLTHNAGQALAFKDSLVDAGLVMEQDFVWRYFASAYDWIGSVEEPGHTVFEFRDPALATFYQLKWS